MKKGFFRDSDWVDSIIGRYTSVLDVGAGGFRRAGHVTTMDMRKMQDTDVIHNANAVPWPFQDNTFDYIILSNVLEHVKDIGAVLNEIHRVSKNGAVVRCICPHYSNPCSYVDVTHCHALSVHSLDIFCIGEKHKFSKENVLVKKILGCDTGVADAFRENLFVLRRRSLYFREALWWTLLPVVGNVFQDFFEVYLSRIFPAWSIYWELEVKK